MAIKSVKRQKRALKTRSKIALTENDRLTVFRSNAHIYAQIITSKGSEILVSASTAESDLKSDNNGNIVSITTPIDRPSSFVVIYFLLKPIVLIANHH